MTSPFFSRRPPRPRACRCEEKLVRARRSRPASVRPFSQARSGFNLQNLSPLGRQGAACDVLPSLPHVELITHLASNLQEHRLRFINSLAPRSDRPPQVLIVTLTANKAASSPSGRLDSLPPCRLPLLPLFPATFFSTLVLAECRPQRPPSDPHRSGLRRSLPPDPRLPHRSRPRPRLPTSNLLLARALPRQDSRSHNNDRFRWPPSDQESTMEKQIAVGGKRSQRHPSR